ncbi:MAG: acyl carrier protein, partial [Vicinamibacterales bacterium]
MPEAAVRARVQAVITGCLAETLQIDLDKVHHERFADYGIDSILAVKLITAISQQLGLMLETTLLVEHDTIGSLTGHLIGT